MMISLPLTASPLEIITSFDDVDGTMKELDTLDDLNKDLIVEGCYLGLSFCSMVVLMLLLPHLRSFLYQYFYFDYVAECNFRDLMKYCKEVSDYCDNRWSRWYIMTIVTIDGVGGTS